MIDVPNILANFNTPLKESVTPEITNKIDIMQFYIPECKCFMQEIVNIINVMLLYKRRMKVTSEIVNKFHG